jgi:hypothetical protein
MKHDTNKEYEIDADAEIEEHETKLPALSSSVMDRDLIKEIAMDIGKDLVAYIEVMYPQAITATSSTFKPSVRNHVFNGIMAALETTDANKMRERLEERKRHRRKWLKGYRDLREGNPDKLKRNVEQMMGERQAGID